jgi:hypothetical protein
MSDDAYMLSGKSVEKLRRTMEWAEGQGARLTPAGIGTPSRLPPVRWPMAAEITGGDAESGYQWSRRDPDDEGGFGTPGPEITGTAWEINGLAVETGTRVMLFRVGPVWMFDGGRALPPGETEFDVLLWDATEEAWTPAATAAVTLLSDYRFDGTTGKLQKKTRAIRVISAEAESDWIDVHTPGACDE